MTTGGGWTDHLVIAPIVVPMLAGTAMVLAGDRRRAATIALGVASTVALVVLSAALIAVAGTPEVRIYRLGDWPSVFGIVLGTNPAISSRHCDRPPRCVVICIFGLNPPETTIRSQETE